MTAVRPRLLVLEDGSEYVEFARAFLGDAFVVDVARTAAEAVDALARGPVDALLVDLRFDRVDRAALVGDVQAIADRWFAGDRERAERYVVDQQGALVLAELRKLGCEARAVFVQDFPRKRLENLRSLYGRVDAVPSFDAARIRALLLAGADDA